MLPYQKINHFPGSYQLGRKNLLYRNLGRMKKYLPNEYDFLPKTWILPQQFEELKSYMDACLFENTTQPKPVLIVKPEASSQGKGIYLTKKYETIGPYEHCVVQEYLPNPYLIDNLKFDLRIYVLIKSINPLKIFIYKEGMARFATVKFDRPKKSNMKNLCMHLTNYAINKKNPDFKSSNENDLEDQGHKRSFSSILRVIHWQSSTKF